MKPIRSLLASLFVLVATTHATVPKLINFQGRLTDSNGQPADANVSISLRVYDAENAGQLTYSENIGTVEVINGIYSFRFGSSGSSTRPATETFGPTDGVAQVFNYTAANTPMLIGSASISDGTVTWTEGVSNATLSGNITHSSGAVSAVYLTGVPSSGKTLTLNYDYNSSSIAGALLDNNESWMEVVIDGQAYSPRKQLVAMPFALVANEALAVSGKINESQLSVSDSPSDIMTMIADLQGQVSQLRAAVNSGKAEGEKMIRQHDWVFSESFSDSNGDLNSVSTADSNATYASDLRSYVSGQLTFSNDGEVSTSFGSGLAGSTLKKMVSYVRSHTIYFHTSYFRADHGNKSNVSIKYVYSDSSTAFSPLLSKAQGSSGNSYYVGPLYHSNPNPEKLVSSIEVWSSANDGGGNTRTKLNRSYSPLPVGETVKIKLNLPLQSKNVAATRVDVLGQVLSTSTLNYELSDGSGTATGLSLSTKNDYGLSQNPTSLTLHFNCPSISTVTVRYWYKD